MLRDLQHRPRSTGRSQPPLREGIWLCSTSDVLHAIRGIIITAPAAANINQPIIPLAATGTGATTTP
jgi:hypothetical protein